MPQYEITTNGRSYPVRAQDLAGLDLIPTGPSSYHLLHEGKSHIIEVIDLQLEEKSLTLRIDGKELSLEIKDEIDLLIKQLGFATVESSKSSDILAPMPGLVLDIMVKPGDEVEAGTPLIILEAMKMENVLKAEGDGTIKTVTVQQGDAVEKRQLLIELE